MTGKASILIIYTGGTIGMRQDPVDQTLKPFDFSQIQDEVPELRKFSVRTDSWAFDPLIDSSDVEPGLWQALAKLIRDKYEEYDGFVILHGTDTMSYSASALSFMLDGLTKPVIFTGSQLPIGAPRTDGRENLISSVEIAAARDAEGHAMVPEVCIFFGSNLIRGNRSVKTNAEAFGAFASPNFPPLAEAGINMRYYPDRIRKPLDWYQNVSINTKLDTRVSILKIHPGITPEAVRYFLCDTSSRAVILETYGAGNAPGAPWFTDIVAEAAAKGKIMVNVTQCLTGKVDMGLYANGKTLEKAGVISGYDSTTESALAKLFYLLGKNPDSDWIKEMMGKNLKGEISK
jgi:L-asparaginase